MALGWRPAADRSIAVGRAHRRSARPVPTRGVAVGAVAWRGCGLGQRRCRGPGPSCRTVGATAVETPGARRRIPPRPPPPGRGRTAGDTPGGECPVGAARRAGALSIPTGHPPSDPPHLGPPPPACPPRSPPRQGSAPGGSIRGGRPRWQPLRLVREWWWPLPHGIRHAGPRGTPLAGARRASPGEDRCARSPDPLPQKASLAISCPVLLAGVPLGPVCLLHYYTSDRQWRTKARERVLGGYDHRGSHSAHP